MQLDFIWTLLISLGLTLFFEIFFCLFFKIRNVHDLALVVLVNIITNPPVVLLHYLLSQKTQLPQVLIVLVLEIAAVMVEGLYYKRYAKKINRPFLFSVGANAFSFLTGLIIQQLI